MRTQPTVTNRSMRCLSGNATVPALALALLLGGLQPAAVWAAAGGTDGECMADVDAACGSPAMQRLAAAAAKIPPPVLLTMVNAPYLPFMLSWLCNTRPMGIHRHVLVMVTDIVSRDSLARFPGITVVFIGDAPPMKTGRTNGQQRDVSANLVYGEVRYWYFMAWRSDAIACLLRSRVALLLFETDAVWLRNPLPEVAQRAVGVDMVLYKDAFDHWGGGFMYISNTDAAREFFWELARRLTATLNRLCSLRDGARASGRVENDQRLLRVLINSKYAGVTHRDFPMDKFPSGQWYRAHAGKHRGRNWRGGEVAYESVAPPPPMDLPNTHPSPPPSTPARALLLCIPSLFQLPCQSS